MNLDLSADSAEEPTENTCLMSEAVAMENRAYAADQSESRPAAGHRGNSHGDGGSSPAVIVPSVETVCQDVFVTFPLVIGCISH